MTDYRDKAGTARAAFVDAVSQLREPVMLGEFRQLLIDVLDVSGQGEECDVLAATLETLDERMKGLTAEG